MLKQEEDEYKSGFEIPDLQDEKNVEALQEWTGEWNTMMSRIKFVRVARDGGVVSVPNKVTWEREDGICLNDKVGRSLFLAWYMAL